MENKLICITGGDRRGKATQALLLSKALDAHLVSFPNYDTLAGQLVRAALTNSDMTLKRRLKGPSPRPEVPWSTLEFVEVKEQWDKTKLSPYHFQCLQMISRLEAQKDILEKLCVGHVVADRYDVDALVYGSVDGCKLDWLEKFLACIRRSDLVIVLKGQTFSREEVADSNENTEFQSRIDEAYDFYSRMYNWRTIETKPRENKLDSIYITHLTIIGLLNREWKDMCAFPLNYEVIKGILGEKNGI